VAYKLIATNRKAFRNFHVSDKWECGIALQGGEVKSIRAGFVNFKDSYARIENREVLLYSLHINPYKEASYMNSEPDRPRKLLLHRREIKKLDALINEKSLTLVPTKIYLNKRGLVKVELGVGRGKKLYDKREDVKKRTIDKALRRAVKVRKR
jgi:SsrA-binding protein